MATEAGHHASRVYRDQNGDFHLNGAKLFNDAETDIAPILEGVVGNVDGATPLKVKTGTVALDGTNPTDVATGLTTIIGAAVSLKQATAPGDDPSWLSCDWSGGTLSIYAWKNTGGTDPTLVASTNSTAVISYIAIGT